MKNRNTFRKKLKEMILLIIVLSAAVVTKGVVVSDNSISETSSPRAKSLEKQTASNNIEKNGIGFVVDKHNQIKGYESLVVEITETESKRKVSAQLGSDLVVAGTSSRRCGNDKQMMKRRDIKSITCPKGNKPCRFGSVYSAGIYHDGWIL